jgi:hypothetical protein
MREINETSIPPYLARFFEKSSIADAHLAAILINPAAGLCLLKFKGNLLVRQSALFHGMSPFSRGELSCRIFILLNG